MPGPPAGVSPAFWRLLLDEPLREATVVDVGTGAGRIALALAPLARRVVGIDRDPELIAEGRRRALASGLRNVEFAVVDADSIGDYRDLGAGLLIEPDLVVAHLYLSDQLIRNAGASLAAGKALAFVGFHVDQWKETGRRSRFAYDEERVRRLLAESGFAVEHLEVEREVREFQSVEEGLAAAVGLEERWKADGRWCRYVEFLEAGGRTLTRSHLIVKARRLPLATAWS